MESTPKLVGLAVLHKRIRLVVHIFTFLAATGLCAVTDAKDADFVESAVWLPQAADAGPGLPAY